MTTDFTREVPEHLKDSIREIRDVAEDKGLDFYTTIFEMVDYDEINKLAAYGGFPKRYPHWRFGMEYDSMSKKSEYGLAQIYEMVINNDPSYAYLLRGNSEVQQKMVVAHVYAHVDFFKNNQYFAKTNRNAINEMANHAARVRRHMEKHGVDKVERFIDDCLAIENLIDPMRPHIDREPSRDVPDHTELEEHVEKLPSKEYLDDYVNPDEWVDRQKARLEEEWDRMRNQNPPEPLRDVLIFLLRHGSLEQWEADILSIIREEAYYFAPQKQTKIQNEGWASFWHSEILKEVLDDSEIIEFADLNSEILQESPQSLNPYRLGVQLFRDIERRWDQGKFGKDWEEVSSIEERENWDKDVGAGRDKIFDVRRVHNDVTFVDEFLTEEFVAENKLYTYGYEERSRFKEPGYRIQSREFHTVKEEILDSLTHSGEPVISVLDGDFHNARELLLHHEYEGEELRSDYAKRVLPSIHRIWKRPVHLETVSDGEGVRLSYDGQHDRESIDYEPLDAKTP
jgi:stage V sporulation protein R